jgi:hypothetical protein
MMRVMSGFACALILLTALSAAASDSPTGYCPGAQDGDRRWVIPATQNGSSCLIKCFRDQTPARIGAPCEQVMIYDVPKNPNDEQRRYTYVPGRGYYRPSNGTGVIFFRIPD